MGVMALCAAMTDSSNQVIAHCCDTETPLVIKPLNDEITKAMPASNTNAIMRNQIIPGSTINQINDILTNKSPTTNNFSSDHIAVSLLTVNHI